MSNRHDKPAVEGAHWILYDEETREELIRQAREQEELIVKDHTTGERMRSEA